MYNNTRLNNRSTLRARMELPVFTDRGGLEHPTLPLSPTEATTIVFYNVENAETHGQTGTERSEDITSTVNISSLESVDDTESWKVTEFKLSFPYYVCSLSFLLFVNRLSYIVSFGFFCRILEWTSLDSQGWIPEHSHDIVTPWLYYTVRVNLIFSQPRLEVLV